MNKLVKLTLTACSVLALASAVIAADIEKGFIDPPNTARPWVYWMWLNGNITKEGLTADLEAMKRVGIGGVLMMDVTEQIPAGPVKHGSPQWRDMLTHAVREASRLGIEMAMHNCAGYSSSGGPWNTPENSMKFVVTSEKRVKSSVRGPLKFKAPIPQPPTKEDFYRDISVIAFRTPDSEINSMKNSAPKVTASIDKENCHKVVDGNMWSAVNLGTPKPDAPQFIQFEFAKPFKARTLNIVSPSGRLKGCGGRIEVSDDGRKFRAVQPFFFQRGWERSVAFPSVSARYFRVVFTDAKGDYYPDQQITELELSSAVPIDNLKAKLMGERGGDCTPGTVTDVPAEDVVQGKNIVDLTSKFGADKVLTWDVPEGDWTILRVGYTSTGARNSPAQESGTGLECDKLNKEAVQTHWDAFMAKIIADLGPGLAGNVKAGLNNVQIDSFERGGQNWTQEFREKFQKRCGYDMMRFLPVFSGRVVDNLEVTERFMWDLRRTIADMFAENYSGQFAKMAHKAGMMFSVEPYGSPSDDMQYGSHADMPMGEFWWSPGGGAGGTPKQAAVIAHVYGRKYVGAEAFTKGPENGGWKNDPFAMKSQGDAAFCAGVNRLIYHRYAHQPWLDRLPGMTMGRWGTHFERTVTWWEQARDWLKYQARCQYLLQEGTFVADVCFYAGEGAPNHLKGNDIRLGDATVSGWDCCSVDALLNLMSVKDGKIVSPSGMSYRMLVLPREKTMTPGVLRKIKELVDGGATVLGPKPEKSPSLIGYPKCDKEVKALADEVWKKVISDKSPAEALTAMGVKPDFQFLNRSSRLIYIHRNIDGADVYFVSNQKQAADASECLFRVSGRVPELWDPETGRIEKAPVYSQEDGRTKVPLKFGPAGSMFVVFREKVSADHIVSVERIASGDLTIIKAEYGAFEPEKKVEDVTKKLKGMVKKGMLSARADNTLSDGRDPASGIVKELRVEYRHDGEVKTARVAQDRLLTLPEGIGQTVSDSDYDLAVRDDGKYVLEGWNPGGFELKMASGKLMKARVKDVPKPVEISGSWELSFPPNWGAPEKVVLDKLISWTDHPNKDVKYFSGTATYRKVFDFTKSTSSDLESRVYLDLGKLKNIAEVKLNGKDLGILWKPPYRVDVNDAVKSGKNKLEIKITNLWVNRLIGDDKLPADRVWSDRFKGKANPIKEWPQWLLDGKPSPTGKYTFTTWNHWKKDDKPLPSGLFGPVTLKTAAVVEVK